MLQFRRTCRALGFDPALWASSQRNQEHLVTVESGGQKISQSRISKRTLKEIGEVIRGSSTVPLVRNFLLEVPRANISIVSLVLGGAVLSGSY